MFAAPLQIAAQVIDVGRVPPGVEVDLVDAPYEIHGETAAQILADLRARAPAGWVSYPVWYSWGFDDLRLSLVDGTPSTSRLPDDFKRLEQWWIPRAAGPAGMIAFGSHGAPPVSPCLSSRG